MTYKIEISRDQGSLGMKREGEQYENIVELSVTNLVAVKDFIDLIEAGTDVSSVVTAIDAL